MAVLKPGFAPSEHPKKQAAITSIQEVIIKGCCARISPPRLGGADCSHVIHTLGNYEWSEMSTYN